MKLSDGTVLNPDQVRTVDIDSENYHDVRIIFGNGDRMLIDKEDAETLRYLISNSERNT